MGLLLPLLRHLESGTSVSREILGKLSVEEREVLLGLETRREAERRWRDITLSLLKSVAKLSGGANRDEILNELVYSARLILRSDIGYISMNKDDGSTYVLSTSGVITESFANIRMPLGVGVLGLVASTREPAWTSDHLNDPRVTHDPEVDEAVRAEGIQSILGAPIVIDNSIIGALLVGNRSRRDFTADEIVVLDSLAALAAVALETSGLIAELEESVEALQASKRAADDQVKNLERVSSVDSRLMDILSEGAQVEALQELLREELKAETWLWRDYPLQPEAGETELPDDSYDVMKKLIVQSRQTGEVAEDESYTALSVTLRNRNVGAISVAKNLNATDHQILRNAAMTWATIVLFREALVAAETSQVDAILRKFFDGRGTVEDVYLFERLSGLSLAEARVSLVASIRGDFQNLVPSDLRHHLHRHGVFLFHPTHLSVLLVGTDEATEALQPLVEQAQKSGYELYIGVSEPVSGVAHFERAHDQADALAESLYKLGVANKFMSAEAMGSLGLLLSVAESSVHEMIQTQIGPLIEYDEANGTELVETAMQYFESDRSATRAAQRLYVHENTIRQRIERISSLLGSTWQFQPRALDIHLALRARTLSKS